MGKTTTGPMVGSGGEEVAAATVTTAVGEMTLVRPCSSLQMKGGGWWLSNDCGRGGSEVADNSRLGTTIRQRRLAGDGKKVAGQRLWQGRKRGGRR
ncbi:hypothetical protein GW17_00021883 [Ensete ventricosum]|nr:hypothetical protein GW17_00021883 [Ensete ventricosum]